MNSTRKSTSAATNTQYPYLLITVIGNLLLSLTAVSTGGWPCTPTVTLTGLSFGIGRLGLPSKLFHDFLVSSLSVRLRSNFNSLLPSPGLGELVIPLSGYPSKNRMILE